VITHRKQHNFTVKFHRAQLPLQA